jgi:hypothetical protein
VLPGQSRTWQAGWPQGTGGVDTGRTAGGGPGHVCTSEATVIKDYGYLG